MQGLLHKIPGNIDLTNYFRKEFPVDRVHGAVDHRNPRRGAGGAGSGGVVKTRPGLAGVVEKTKPTSGAHVSAGG
jgi:hypothetical protein